MDESPIEIDDENKIKLKPDSMIKEKIYPFIHEDSIFLFYKDDNELINCYEIVDNGLRDKILKDKTRIIEILKENFI